MGIGYLIVKMLHLVLANHNYERLPTFYNLCFFLVLSIKVLADGSKKLYPNGFRGSRAFMKNVTDQNGQLTHNHYNHARHFAYLLEDETFAVASSVEDIRGDATRVIRPSGREYSINNDVFGRIFRSADLTNR